MPASVISLECERRGFVTLSHWQSRGVCGLPYSVRTEKFLAGEQVLGGGHYSVTKAAQDIEWRNGHHRLGSRATLRTRMSRMT